MPSPRREVPPETPRPGRLLIRAGFVFLALVAVGAVCVAADWWICLPEGAMEAATYVGRQACVACHQEECDQWAGSDHDLAMDHATPETVLGDFDDCEFTLNKSASVTRLSLQELGDEDRAFDGVLFPTRAEALEQLGVMISARLLVEAPHGGGELCVRGSVPLGIGGFQ